MEIETDRDRLTDRQRNRQTNRETDKERERDQPAKENICIYCTFFGEQLSLRCGSILIKNCQPSGGGGDDDDDDFLSVSTFSPRGV